MSSVPLTGCVRQPRDAVKRMRLEKRGLVSQQFQKEYPSLLKGRKYRAEAKRIYSPSLLIHSSDMSIIQIFMTNNIQEGVTFNKFW